MTGIGFLGAGAIIVRGISVRGLTTAATLWVVAAIGMAAGTGYYAVAVGAAALVLVSLGPLKLVSSRLVSRVRPEEAELGIRLAPEGEATRVLDAIEKLGGQISHVEFGDDRTIDVVLRALAPVGVGARRGEGQRARGRRARAVAPVTLKGRLASGNAHKLEELRAALPGWELELLDAPEPFPPEDGETYYENARAKADFGRRVAPADAWMLGEDSGIEVAALGGRPGIASARWAEDGVAQLLEELRRRRGPARPVRLRARRALPRRRGVARNRHPRGRDRDRAPRRGGLRLRPDLRPRGRGAHRRRARKRLEAGALPPRPRRGSAPPTPRTA